MIRLAPKNKNQNLPSWVDMETERKRRRPKAPSPKDMPKASLWMCEFCGKKVSSARTQCWNCGALKESTPKAKPEIPRLHIRIELTGACEMLFEGEQAKEFRALLTGGASAEDVIEALDPYSSGVVIKQEIRILEDPDKPSGEFFSWAVSEERGTFDGWVKPAAFGPFRYSAAATNLLPGKPTGVDWRQVQ